MSTLNEDKPFLLSMNGYERLMDGAKKAGIPLARFFRWKAAQLVRIADPKFDVSGAMLHRRIEVGVPERVYDGLRELCRDLGVPFDTAGELVACAAFMPVLSA